jgi:hypothetical protein
VGVVVVVVVVAVVDVVVVADAGGDGGDGMICEVFLRLLRGGDAGVVGVDVDVVGVVSVAGDAAAGTTIAAAGDVVGGVLTLRLACADDDVVVTSVFVALVDVDADADRVDGAGAGTADSAYNATNPPSSTCAHSQHVDVTTAMPTRSHVRHSTKSRTSSSAVISTHTLSHVSLHAHHAQSRNCSTSSCVVDGVAHWATARHATPFCASFQSVA